MTTALKTAALRTTALRRPGAVVSAAGSLLAATLVTSALGFAFWAVAARLAPVAAVGSASAAISLMQLLGSLGTLGLGTLLIGELAERRAHARPLVVSGTAVAALGGGVAGLAVGAVLAAVTSTPGALVGTPRGLLLFALGTAVTSATTVLDQSLVGLGLGGRQLRRNAVFAVLKLVLLPVLAATTGLSALGLYAAWTAAHLLSCLPLLRTATRGPLLPRPWPLRGLGGQAFAHHLMNVGSHAPLLVLPSLVTWRVGPAAGAAFFVAVLLTSFPWVVSAHLSTALFTVRRDDTDRLRRELRTSLRICSAVAVAAGVGTLLLAGPVLQVFGSDYRQGRGALVLLALATGPSAVKSLFVAVRRVQGRLAGAATWTTAGSLLEIAGGTAGLLAGGLTGAALGVLLAMLLESAALLGPVLSAARREEADGAARPAPDDRPGP